MPLSRAERPGPGLLQRSPPRVPQSILEAAPDSRQGLDQREDPQDRDEQTDDLRHGTAPSAPARQPTRSSSIVPEHDNGIDGAGAARRDEGGGGRHSEHDDARDADQSRIPRGRVWQQSLREPPDGE
jgi:hypothetical protein